MNRYKQLFKEKTNSNLSYATQLIIDEANSRDVNVSVIDNESQLLKLDRDNNTQYFMQCVLSKNSSIADFMVSSKYVTKKILNQNSYNTCKYFLYNDKEKALEDYNQFEDDKYVIKPNKGAKGEGISFISDITTEVDYKKYIKFAFDVTLDTRILIEEYIEGKEYRFLIVDNECIAVIQKIPPNVIGDGISTIQQLVDIKNKDEKRGNDSSYPLRKIKNGDREKATLKRKDLSLESILEKDKIIFLRDNANIDDGGDSIGIPIDVIDYEYIQLVLDIADLFQVSNYCAVDIKINDIKNFKDYSIIEINNAPGFASIVSPYKGLSVPVQKDILTLLNY